MPRIETQNTRPPPRDKAGDQPHSRLLAWALGLGVGFILLLVGLTSLNRDDSDSPAPPPAVVKTDPPPPAANDTFAPEAVPPAPASRAPLPLLTEPVGAVEQVRQEQLRALQQQTTEQPTSAMERSRLALTPEQLKDLETSGRMIF